MDYEPGLCDLVRAIDLTLIALAEPEADARIVQAALENAQRTPAGYPIFGPLPDWCAAANSPVIRIVT